ncbi:MAG: hypothetical protein IJ688_08095 [Treponema sp.]|nr:hypothetical protein [Treponema sp.]
MKKNYLIFCIFYLAALISCASNNINESQPEKEITPVTLDSCFVDTDYDFVFEIANNSKEMIFVSNGVKGKRASFDSLIESKAFSVKAGETFQLKYNLALLEKSLKSKIQNLDFYVLMSSENNTAISGNEKNICIYEKDGRYVTDRHFYSDDKEPLKVLAGNKYLLTLSDKGNEINAFPKIEDLSGFVYDPIIPGNGKSPIRLQLKNSKEYIEVDWQYCKSHKENRTIMSDGTMRTSVSSADWKIFESGKDLQLFLNYNRNNDYYAMSSVSFEWDDSHSNKIRKQYFDKIRPYTVEELELLIGVKN